MSDPQVMGENPRQPNEDKKLIDELIFKQDLNEVHLLIDFVSGRADRSLGTLTMPNPAAPGEMMSSGEIVRVISEMRYPPGPDSAVNAQNAAILLMAKDRLSALADPARGFTIAYTTMFIDAEAGRNSARRWWRKITGQPVELPRANGLPHPDPRIDLAERTFPGLKTHAAKFCVWRDLLSRFAIVWLFLTGLAYWDAGLGRATLERLDQNWKVVIAERRDNPAVLSCGPDFITQVPRAEDAKATDDAQRRAVACNRHLYLTLAATKAVEEVQHVFRCDETWADFVHVWCWHWLLSGTQAALYYRDGAEQSDAKPSLDPKDQAAERKKRLEDNATYWQIATSTLSVFTTYVLPMMFALLGTLIGAFRAILNRIGNGELAPRDLVRMKVGIPAGLVAGIAVGLFLSPSSVPVQGAGGVASDLTLTASGLGFLAGYASQSFFGYLDKIVNTVFPIGGPTIANSATTIISVNAPAARPAGDRPTGGGQTGATGGGPTGAGPTGHTGATGGGPTGPTGSLPGPTGGPARPAGA